MIRWLIPCALLATTGCKSESGADPAEVEVSGPTRGSNGGFSAALSAELGSSGAEAPTGAGGGSGTGRGTGSEPAGTGLQRTASGVAPTTTTTTTTAPAIGSGAGSGSGSGSGSVTVVTAGSGSAALKVGTGSGSAPPAVVVTPPPKAGSAAPPPVVVTPPSKAGSASPPVAVAPPPKAGSAATPAPPPVAVTPPVAKAPVAMTPELRAIKLSLQPNWDRDVVEAGTISLYEKNANATFKFTYGYEDPKAPADRDAYKKFLADSRTLVIRLDRQSGAAWYLEGTDASGHAAFRIVVTYGGKRLVCYGSLYKDAGLGDLRDDVVLQAKKICESIQL